MSVKDFGEWVVPTSWDEVTLGQLLRVDAERMKETPSLVYIMSVLCGREVSEVEQLPVDFVEKIAGKMSFISTQPDVVPSCSMLIDGEEYVVNAKEKLRFGEFVAVETAMKGDSSDIAMLLAIVCRKRGEVYDSAFENEMLAERREMFLGASCTQVLPVVSFFLASWMVRSELSRNYSAVKAEVVSCIQRLIENSRTHGAGSKSLTRLQTRKLRRLKGYIERTY